MPLDAGHKLAHYEIVEPIGKGGMGEVYRARDTKLDREVAIKVLPEEFAQDDERLARFEREARLLASVNHPNVATLHDFEEANGTRFLAMELVEGETLAERIARGPIAFVDAKPMFEQIAAGLHAAHENGVIHRDLKPANIKITPDGTPKILDFGLAKVALNPDVSGESPTVTRQGTEAGIILGTAAYMSPEQARGQPLDKRSDVWSYGCVFFEALTGRCVFLGETVSDTIARILEREPNWRALPERTPVLVRSLLRRCLAKDPAHRLHDLADARIEIEDATSEPVEAIPTVDTSRRTLVALGAIAVAATVVALWALTRSGTPEPKAVTRTVIPLPEDRSLALEFTTAVALSPDGKYVAYFAMNEGTTELHLRALDELEATPIAGSEGGSTPFFSPDSQWLGFGMGSTVMKVPVSGGAPVPISEGYVSRGASWGERGVVLSSVGRVLRLAAMDARSLEVLTTLDRDGREKAHRFPEVLPGGRAVLFTIGTTEMESWDEGSIAVLDLDTGERQVLLDGGMSARYSPSGHLVYARAGSLVAVPFDVDKLEVTGNPIVVIDGVSMSPIGGNAEFSLSRDGALLYAPGGMEGIDRQVVWVDRQGRAEPFIETPRAFSDVRFSPDGRFLAISIAAGNDSVWVHDIARGILTRLAQGSDNIYPVWMPGGERMTFTSNRNGPYNLFSQPADGSEPAEPLATSDSVQQAGSWTPDGQTLVFMQGDDLWSLSPDEDRRPLSLLEADHRLRSPRLSSNGHWLAYTSDESGREEVYLQAFPELGRRHQVSSRGGFDPVWNPDGRELFYRVADAIHVVDVRDEGELELGTPRLLFETPSRFALTATRYGFGAYDVAPDGRRFAMVVRSESETKRTELIYVQNFAEELKRLVPTGH